MASPSLSLATQAARGLLQRSELTADERTDLVHALEVCDRLVTLEHTRAQRAREAAEQGRGARDAAAGELLRLAEQGRPLTLGDARSLAEELEQEGQMLEQLAPTIAKALLLAEKQLQQLRGEVSARLTPSKPAPAPRLLGMRAAVSR